MQVWPNPMRDGCRISFPARHGGGGTLVVFDAQARTVRLLRPGSDMPGEMRVERDGRDHGGRRVRPGQYFARWQPRGEKAAARITVVD